PRWRASAATSEKTLPAAAPAAFGPYWAAAAAASAAAFFAHAASSTPTTSDERVARVAGAADDADRAGLGALGDVGAGQRAAGDEPLGEDEHAGAARDARAVRGDRLRQCAGGDGEDDEVVVVELDLGGAAHPDGFGQLDAGQVALVAPLQHELGRLVGRAAGQVDLDACAGERDRDARSPRAGADDRGAADG